MQPIFGDTINYRIAEQPPKPGAFFIRGRSNWYKCREQFAKHFSKDTNGFYVSLEHECSNIGLPEFLAITEDLLSIEEPSVYQKSTNPVAIFVRPSEFWRSCPIRRSLFTILLRAGLAYRPRYNTWEDAIYTQEYIRITRKAVLRFMYGSTKFVPGERDRAGWVTTFRHCTEDEIRRKLIFPGGSSEFGIVGTGTLWG
jgi:hypothetical protein